MHEPARKPAYSSYRNGGRGALPSPIKLAHVVLKTYDVERLRKWYCTLLDGYVTFEALPFASFVTYDDEHHRLAFIGIPGAERAEPTWQGPGLVHIAFTFSDIRALLVQYEILKGQGIAPGVAINHGPTVSLYYNDPDGNAVELQIDRLTLEEGQAFMASPAFRKNSNGVPIDADSLVRRMKEGADDAELLFYDADASDEQVDQLVRDLTELVHL